MISLVEKLEKLKSGLAGLESAAIAYSGGVDSAFLCKVAHDVLNDRVSAFTALSPSYAKRDREESTAVAKAIGIRQHFFETGEIEIEGYNTNPPSRCYFCKTELYGKLLDEARRLGFKYVLDGTNIEDAGDHRPGLRAAQELQVRSPLKEAGLTKDEIRTLSRDMGLPTWDKPSEACLSSRFQYGDPITVDKLRRVELAEDFLKTRGFRILRVRDHGDLARIETSQDEMTRLLNPALRKEIADQLKRLGYQFISFDLEGFRSGSANEVLK